MLGPIDFLAVEFPDGKMTGAGFRLLGELAARGTIAVLDLEFVVKSPDGTVSRVALEDVPQMVPVDVSSWAGSFSGILDESDLETVAAAIGPGSLAGILVYENAWASPIMTEIVDSGARLLGSGRVDNNDLNDALGITGVTNT
ncbi:DUF6325 family protein [Cellulomonas sp. McL0617]|uniref:DUF6325 family protein n=1 Tax=Cellulomonas sp. McL0617 TaxID=3415675 RepID=UPI003CECA6DA